MLVDAYFTHRRVKLFGVAIELSGLVGAAIRKFGVVDGIGLGLILPNLVVVGFLLPHPMLLAAAIGARAHLAYWQLNSFETEAAMLEAIKEMRADAEYQGHAQADEPPKPSGD